MPFQVQPFPVTNSAFAQEQRFRIERGRLKGVSLRNHNALSGQNQAFGQLWLCFDDNPSNLDGLLLAQGHLGASLALGWTGDIPLLGAMAIRAVIWIPFTGTFQVTAYTEVP